MSVLGAPLGKRLVGKPSPDFDAGLRAVVRRRVPAQFRVVPDLPLDAAFLVTLPASVNLDPGVANRALDDRQSLRLIGRLNSPVTMLRRHSVLRPMLWSEH